MTTVRLLIVLLIICLLTGAYWYACKIQLQCLNSGANTEAPVNKTAVVKTNVNKTAQPNFILNDGDSLLVSNKEGFRFPVSSGEPIIPNSISDDFDKIAEYLKSNNSKKLYLSGKYKKEEAPSNGFADLGLARADKLVTEFLKRGVSPKQLFFGSEMGVENEKGGFIYDGVAFSFSKPNLSNLTSLDKGNLPGAKFSINDGQGISIDLEENVNFPKNSATPTITDKISSAFKQTASYLKTNRDRILQITGLYTRDEKNQSQHPNLGVARAEAIKNELVKKGANKTQVSVTSKIVPKLPFNGNILNGGVEYSFKTKQEIADYEKKLMDDIYAKINNIGSMNLYFDFGAKQINLSPKLANYIEDVKLYLAKNNTAKVRLIGHTDDKGSAQSNYGFGMDRAKFVKNYFVNSGVRSSQIITESKGEQQPIASNDTDAGRAKNRRVEITIN